MTKRSYTAAQVDEALSLAWQLQSPTRAANELKIPAKTLATWVRETHAGRYEELAQAHREAMDETLTDAFILNAKAAAEAADEATAKARQAIKDGDPKAARDYAGAARDFSMVHGINTDKSRVIQGKPTQGAATPQSAHDLLEAIRKELAPSFDSTAEEFQARELPAGVMP